MPVSIHPRCTPHPTTRATEASHRGPSLQPFVERLRPLAQDWSFLKLATCRLAYAWYFGALGGGCSTPFWARGRIASKGRGKRGGNNRRLQRGCYDGLGLRQRSYHRVRR